MDRGRLGGQKAHLTALSSQGGGERSPKEHWGSFLEDRKGSCFQMQENCDFTFLDSSIEWHI